MNSPLWLPDAAPLRKDSMARPLRNIGAGPCLESDQDATRRSVQLASAYPAKPQATISAERRFALRSSLECAALLPERCIDPVDILSSVLDGLHHVGFSR